MQRCISIFLSIIFALFVLPGIASASFCFIPNGCTGTSTAPGYGQMLIGGKNGEYELVASSTLGSASGGSSFSTTSASYFLSQNQGNAFSTTSAAYWGGLQGYLTGNQTITLSGDVTGTGATTISSLFNLANGHWWTARQNFTNASTSQITATSSIVASYLTPSQLVATDANDKLVSTTTIGASQISGLTTADFVSPNISQWTNDSGYVTSSFSTTSAAYWQTTSNFFSTTSASNFLALNQGNAFSTTSVNFWKTATDLFSTTSASYFLSQNQANAFSTTSANAWKAVTVFTGASTTLLTDNNAFSGTNIFATSTFTGTLSLNAAYGTSTIASGQGFTVGGTKLVVNGATGFVGISTTSPAAPLEVVYSSGGGTQAVHIAQDNTVTAPTQLRIQGFTNSNQQLLLGYNTASNYGSIQPLLAGTAYQNLVLNPAGGNVGIATTSPFARLSIAGSAGGTIPLFSLSSSTAVFATSTVFQIDQNGNTTIGGNGSVLTVNGATTTHANGINLTSGCLTYNGGACIGGSAGSSASTTLLTDTNTFSGIDIFSKLLRLSATTSALLGTDASGNIIATSSIGVNLLTGIIPVANGGTGQSSLGSVNVSSFNNDAGYVTGASAFSTTSAAYFLSVNQGNAFSTSSASYWKSVTDMFSTTSASNFLSLNQGNAFSTTSANYWKSQNIFTGASTTLLANNNTFSGNNIFSASTTFAAQLNLQGASSSSFSASNIWDSALTPGNCVQAGTGGVLTTTGSACGAGGSSASSTLLTDNNTFAGQEIFTGNSTTTGLMNASSTLTFTPGASTTASIVVNVPNMGPVPNATTSNVLLENLSPATVTAQQASPMLTFTGQGWGTTAGASQPASFGMYELGLQSTVPLSSLIFCSVVNQSACAARMTLFSNGSLTLAGAVTGVTTLANSALQTETRVTLATTTNATGLLLTNSTAATALLNAQEAPTIDLRGRAWNGSASALDDWFFGATPNPTGVFSIATSTFSFAYASAGVGTTTIMSMLSNGNTGFGTTTPNAAFVLNGTLSTAQNLLQIASSTNQNLLIVNRNGLFGLGTSTPWARLSVTGFDKSTTTPALVIADASNTPLFNVQDNGFVGVGSSSPNYLLSVGSLFSVSSTGSTTASQLTVVSGTTGTSTVVVGDINKAGCAKFRKTDLSGWLYLMATSAGPAIWQTQSCEQ